MNHGLDISLLKAFTYLGYPMETRIYNTYEQKLVPRTITFYLIKYIEN